MLFPIALLGGTKPSWWWLVVPFNFFLASLLGFALGMWAAKLVYAVRDIAQTIPLIIRVLMFVSGVFYDIEKRFSTAPDVIRILAEYNPAALILKFSRAGLMPDLHTVPTLQLVWAIGFTLVALVGGVLFYWRGER